LWIHSRRKYNVVIMKAKGNPMPHKMYLGPKTLQIQIKETSEGADVRHNQSDPGLVRWKYRGYGAA
jgi:hypothetical protein